MKLKGALNWTGAYLIKSYRNAERDARKVRVLVCLLLFSAVVPISEQLKELH